MRLFHFTARGHWPRIRAAGFIKVTESNLSFRREHAGADVVWLTDDSPAGHEWSWAEVADASGNIIGRVSKTAIRIAVEVPDDEVHWWPKWSRAQGIRDWVYRALAKAGGDPKRWWVVTRPVPRSEWIEVIDTASREVLWSREVRP